MTSDQNHPASQDRNEAFLQRNQARNNIARRIILGLLIMMFLGVGTVVGVVFYLNSTLPSMITLEDYDPLLVTEVYDRGGNKIGEFAREKRTLVPYQEIPKIVVNAFLAAEDSSFFEHGGINYIAILRAFIANIRAGQKVQGASTITQQVARSLLLSRTKTYERKIKEVLLAYKMEANLSKEDILYLYLNQIFLGHNSYGIVVATQTYFNKDLKDITLAEAAILAGLPKAPSTLNPITSPERSKERQRYVISRMLDEGMISKEEAQAAVIEPVKIYMRRSYSDLAPAFLDTVKQLLVSKLGEEPVLDDGLRVYTSVDLPKQLEAQKQVQEGLRELDKRQGYRGPIETLQTPELIAEFLLKSRNNLLDEQTPYKIMQPDGTFPQYGPLNLTGFEQQEDEDTEPKPLPVLPSYIKPGTIMKGIVTRVDDEWGLTYVRFAESKGLIDIETMKWARKPDPDVNARWAPDVDKPSEALKQGDVIWIRVIDDRFDSSRINDKIAELKQKHKKNFKMPEELPNFTEYAEVHLEQEPKAQAALLAIDQKTDDVISMVGGYEALPGQLNRALQASRQTGSAFKTIVYTAALDHGYTPASLILDAPIVFEEEQEVAGAEDKEIITKRWKPTNHSNRFMGDILFRNALIQSLNVPTVKIIEKLGVPLVADYARRLGIFSPLNMDYTLALGSSGVTLYEMTKMFAQIGRLGRRAKPVMVHKVEDKEGQVLHGKIYLDERFEKEIQAIEDDFELRRQNYLAYKHSQETGEPYNPIVSLPKQSEAPADETIAEAEAAAPAPTRDPANEPPLFFKDKDQLIKPDTAYVITSLLNAVVEEDGGTGGRARALGRPTAGKTGSTNQYYDAWFLGFTPDVAAGVWVGFDQEQSLGRGEVGGRAALPIWTEYMKAAHDGLPTRGFNVPDGIVFASIDNSTGKLASATSKEVVRQAFIAGTEPQETQDETSTDREDTRDFYKEDLSE